MSYEDYFYTEQPTDPTLLTSHHIHSASLGGTQAPPAGVKCLILGGAFGHSLGDDLKQAGDARVVVGGTAARATRPLLSLGPDGKSALDRWVACIQQCQHVSLSETYIVANQDNINEYVNWSLESANGFDRGNILDNEATAAETRPGPARDLLFAVESTLGQNDHILLIDGNSAPVPGFDLNALVTRALSRGKDTVVRVELGDGQIGDASDLIHLQVASAAPGSKRCGPHADVLSVTPFPEGSAPDASQSHFAVGSAMLLRNETVGLVRRFFNETGDLEPSRESLGKFLQWSSRRNQLTAVSIPNGVSFPLNSVSDCTVADKFFAFYGELERKAVEELEPVKVGGPSLSSSTRKNSASVFSASSTEGDLRKRMLQERFALGDKRAGNVQTRAIRAALDLSMVLPMFWEQMRKESNASDDVDENSLKVIGPDGKWTRPLPDRFRDADRWNVSKNKPTQHPCYVTTNTAVYGKTPTVADMPLRWHGITGDFTSKFAGNYVDSGFVVQTLKSKVHSSLDGE